MQKYHSSQDFHDIFKLKILSQIFKMPGLDTLSIVPRMRHLYPSTFDPKSYRLTQGEADKDKEVISYKPWSNRKRRF